MGTPETDTSSNGAYEALLHFLYQLPVAVVQMNGLGQISAINPQAVALLQSLGIKCFGKRVGRELLAELDPEIAELTWASAYEIRTVVSRRELSRYDQDNVFRHLALSVQVTGPDRIMITLEDLTEIRQAVSARHATERRYQELVETVPAGVVIHGPSSEIRIANRTAQRLLGLSVEQLFGREAISQGWHFLREDGTRMPVEEFPVNVVLATHEPLEKYVVGICRSDVEQPLWVIVNATPVFNEEGELLEVCISFNDISDLKKVEERLRLVLEGSRDAPWDWDLVRGSLYYSPKWWELMGRAYQPGNTDAMLWQSFLHPDDLTRATEILHAALKSSKNDFEVECRFLRPDQQIVHTLVRGLILRDGDGRATRISGTVQDLTERKRAEAEIERLAFSDALTGLPNRRRFLERLEDSVLGSSRTELYGALLFIDLDKFKQLNDTRGHAYGDKLLQMVGQRLMHCTRSTDMVGRLGGDEFVLLLEHLSANKNDAALDAEKVANGVLEALSQPFDVGLGLHDLRVGASIGITLYGPATGRFEDLLKEADLAMYRAKVLGGHQVHFFEEGMQAAVEERVTLEADLRSGLARGEVKPYYQIQVNDRYGLIGAEVLARWVHPSRGLVSPALFIPLAEDAGLILELGNRVLRDACRNLSAWSNDPVMGHLSLSVNVSLHQLHAPHFVQDVLSALSDSGAPPGRLKLEITESAMAKDIDVIIEKMRELKTHGIQFGLDDFGTGYSSLSHLKKLPLDILKIDVSFIRDVLTDPSDATLVRTIVNLSRDFGLKVIAEGVESQEQRAFLEGVGCHTFQGYLFGRPQPLDEFVQTVTKWYPSGQPILNVS